MSVSRKIVCALVAGGLALVASAAGTGTAAAKSTSTCSGSPKAPGVLVGSHEEVTVTGACEVNAGHATVSENLTLAPGSVLIVAFALNDHTGKGASSLAVGGDLLVGRGATLILGCDPQSFACLDDNPSHPTLSSYETVGGSLVSDHPLGVIVHNTSILGSVDQDGGGGGFNCTPQGIFVAFKSPVFSAYEDSFVGGGVSVSHVNSCWLGISRVNTTNVRVANDQLADPDAVEILSNNISGDITCLNNSMVWDSAEAGFPHLYPRIPQPNTVNGQRLGQCVLASPTKPGGPSGPGPF